MLLSLRTQRECRGLFDGAIHLSLSVHSAPVLFQCVSVGTCGVGCVASRTTPDAELSVSSPTKMASDGIFGRPAS